MTIADDLKARTQALYDMFGTGDLSLAGDLIAPDLVSHDVIEASGPGVFRGLVEAFRNGFPDLKVAVIDMIQDEDRVAVRFRLSGTHTGEFAGVPPTGRSFQITAFDIVRFNEEGLAVEHWGQADDLSMLMQLGLLTPPPQ